MYCEENLQNSRKLELTNISHQLSLDGEDSFSGCLTVGFLACDNDHLGVTVLSREVDLGVGLLADLLALTALFFSLA